MRARADLPQPPPARFGPGALSSLVQAVGRTPLVRIRKLAAHLKGVEVWAKLEWFNPGGSVKDRPALRMVLDAVEDGRLTHERVLVDSTSGNTGVAYAWIGAALGYRVALVMPANVSAARKQLAAAYGAEVIYSDPLEGSDGAIRHVRRLVEAHPGRYFYPDQYSNPSNPRAHELTTAPEIVAQTHGRVTHFVCGMGTSGTVMGTARGLRALVPGVRVVGVEPAEAMHGLEGLKHMPSSLVPAIYRPEALDEKLSVDTEAGWELSERLLHEEGLLAGHSAGAALAGALRVAQRLSEAGQPGVVVTLFPDRADRYFEPARWERSYPW